VATLAVVAGGILLVGYWLRPTQPTTDEQVPAPSQTELSRLTQITQRRSLDDMTDYFSTVADDVRASVVGLPSLELSGVMWEPGVALTARTDPRFPLATTVSTPGGDNIGVASDVFGPQIPIATVQMSDIQGLAPTRQRSAAVLSPGSWMLAVWRRQRAVNFVPAYFLGTAIVQCGDQMVDELRSNVAWSRDMAGGGLFDLDSSLIGIILPCGDRFAAVAGESISTMLQQGSSTIGRVLGRYGVLFDSLTEDEQVYFGRGGGVVIREVWTGYPADAAGLKPGDILIAINAEPIGAPEQLAPLGDATDVDTLDVAVLRGDEIVPVVLSTDTSLFSASDEVDVRPGIVWEPEPVGHLIDSVVPNSPADIAGIRAGDRLVRIDSQEPVGLAQAVETLAPDREESVFLEIDRAGRRWGVLLK
jgi:hypothetical protein